MSEYDRFWHDTIEPEGMSLRPEPFPSEYTPSDPPLRDLAEWIKRRDAPPRAVWYTVLPPGWRTQPDWLGRAVHCRISSPALGIDRLLIRGQITALHSEGGCHITWDNGLPGSGAVTLSAEQWRMLLEMQGP